MLWVYTVIYIPQDGTSPCFQAVLFNIILFYAYGIYTFYVATMCFFLWLFHYWKNMKVKGKMKMLVIDIWQFRSFTCFRDWRMYGYFGIGHVCSRWWFVHKKRWKVIWKKKLHYQLASTCIQRQTLNIASYYLLPPASLFEYNRSFFF